MIRDIGIRISIFHGVYLGQDTSGGAIDYLGSNLIDHYLSSFSMFLPQVSKGI